MCLVIVSTRKRSRLDLVSDTRGSRLGLVSDILANVSVSSRSRELRSRSWSRSRPRRSWAHPCIPCIQGSNWRGLGGLTPPFLCLFHCDPPTPQLFSSCCIADPPSSFFTIRALHAYNYKPCVRYSLDQKKVSSRSRLGHSRVSSRSRLGQFGKRLGLVSISGAQVSVLVSVST